MRRRFFVERFEGNSATLRGEGAEHLGRVLRAEPGQLYELSDGERVWLGRVERVSAPKRGEPKIDFDLVEPVAARHPKVRIQLLISLIKFDRFEWCVEKATELGVNEIVPLNAARTDKGLAAAAGKRHKRWQKIAHESAQQSRRMRAPEIQGLKASEDAFSYAHKGCKILLSERPDARPMNEVLASIRDLAASVAIGPEGGWTDAEFGLAQAAGFVEVSLGTLILRTETAVLASLAVLQFALGG
jgi:16S rRNA (uracil1498-N3)-methyltransferase